MALVYIHRRLDNNEIFYIGISKNKRRAFETYAKAGNRRNIVWKRISDKHGVNVEITHENICWEEACLIEKYLIEFWRSQGLFLANLTDGGEGVNGYKCSSLEKQRRAAILNSSEIRIKQKKSMSRPDVKSKQSAIQKKVYSNPLLRKKQSEIQKLIQNTPEAIENNRLRALKQNSDHNMRKRISESLKIYYLNNKNLSSKETLQYSLDGTLIKKYVSTKKAANDNNFCYARILFAIKNETKYRGYLWKRK